MSGYGICVCGLNGSGKTTLAGALARKLDFKHMDIEDYYFLPSEIPYSVSRTREEAERLLSSDMQNYHRFVFSAVDGNLSSEINVKYDLVIYLHAPLDVRMERVKKRELDKFGDRVLPDGDMYEQEQRFFDFVSKRNADTVEAWIETVSCPVIYLDGTRNIDDNVREIIQITDLPRASLYTREPFL